MKGIADLAVLARPGPGAEVHALELMGGHDVGGSGRAASSTSRPGGRYQERIVELQREIDEARADHDVRRAERAELELDALVEQLSEAFGLGGRARSTGSSAERARTAVTVPDPRRDPQAVRAAPRAGPAPRQRRAHGHVVLVPAGDGGALDGRQRRLHLTL